MSKASEKTTFSSSDFSDSPSATVKRNLENALSFSDFLAKNKEHMLDPHLSEHLMMLLRQKGLRRADVIEDSGLSKAYVYQIFNGDKMPSRDKLIAIAFGLHLNEEETQRMLKLAGYSELYPRVARDALILLAIRRGMDISDTDDKLDENGFPTLFSVE